MRVYVVRHGESEANLSKQFTGWMDVHLTDQGRAQARGAGEFLQKKGLYFVHSHHNILRQ